MPSDDEFREAAIRYHEQMRPRIELGPPLYLSKQAPRPRRTEEDVLAGLSRAVDRLMDDEASITDGPPNAARDRHGNLIPARCTCSATRAGPCARCSEASEP